MKPLLRLLVLCFPLVFVSSVFAITIGDPPPPPPSSCAPATLAGNPQTGPIPQTFDRSILAATDTLLLGVDPAANAISFTTPLTDIKSIAVDANTGNAIVGTSAYMYVYSPQGDVIRKTSASTCSLDKIIHLALNPASGDTWLSSDSRLTKLNASGQVLVSVQTSSSTKLLRWRPTSLSGFCLLLRWPVTPQVGQYFSIKALPNTDWAKPNTWQSI